MLLFRSTGHHHELVIKLVYRHVEMANTKKA